MLGKFISAFSTEGHKHSQRSQTISWAASGEGLLPTSIPAPSLLQCDSSELGLQDWSIILSFSSDNGFFSYEEAAHPVPEASTQVLLLQSP